MSTLTIFCSPSLRRHSWCYVAIEAAGGWHHPHTHIHANISYFAAKEVIVNLSRFRYTVAIRWHSLNADGLGNRKVCQATLFQPIRLPYHHCAAPGTGLSRCLLRSPQCVRPNANLFQVTWFFFLFTFFLSAVYFFLLWPHSRQTVPGKKWIVCVSVCEFIFEFVGNEIFNLNFMPF